MKLPIAIAVLFLVFAANTEAKEEEITLEERFQTFGTQMQAFGEDVAAKTKSTFEDIHNSDAMVKTRNFFVEQFEKMKKKMVETFPQQ